MSEPNDMSGWLPIETAPKDGTKIIVYCKHMGVVGPSYWDADRYSKRPIPYWTNYGEILWGKKRTRFDQPTHWMPLPQPPTVTQEKN